MKKYIIISLAVAFSMLFCACSGQGDVETTVPQTTTATATTVKETQPVATPPVTEAETEPVTEASTEEIVEVTEPDNSYIILGKWKVTHYVMSDSTQTEAKQEIIYNFKDDGNFTVNINGNEATGIYTYENNVITYTSDTTGESGTFTYDSSTATLNDADAHSDLKAVMVKIIE